MKYNLQFLTLNENVCFDIEYTENPINNSIINEFVNDVRITTYGTKKVKHEGFIVLLNEFAKIDTKHCSLNILNTQISRNYYN